MLEIVKYGIIETDDQLMELTKQYGQVVIPNEDEDLDLTPGPLVVRELEPVEPGRGGVRSARLPVGRAGLDAAGTFSH